MEPYGARNVPSQSTNSRGGSQYVYTNTRHADTNHLAHSFSQLSTTGYGGYSQGFVPPPRTSSISHGKQLRLRQVHRWTASALYDIFPTRLRGRQSGGISRDGRCQRQLIHSFQTAPRAREPLNAHYDARTREWSTNRNPTSPPAVSFGSTSADAPESSRAAERRVAPGLSTDIGHVGSLLISIEYGSISAPANALDPIPRFSKEGIPSDVYASRGTTVSRHGSSLDAHASPGSYPNYDTISASATASGNRTSRSGAESSNGRLDPSEDA